MLAIRTDSAGVEIILTNGPVWPPNEGWQIDMEPALQIGHRSDGDRH